MQTYKATLKTVNSVFAEHYGYDENYCMYNNKHKTQRTLKFVLDAYTQVMRGVKEDVILAKIKTALETNTNVLSVKLSACTAYILVAVKLETV